MARHAEEAGEGLGSRLENGLAAAGTASFKPTALGRPAGSVSRACGACSQSCELEPHDGDRVYLKTKSGLWEPN